MILKFGKLSDFVLPISMAKSDVNDCCKLIQENGIYHLPDSYMGTLIFLGDDIFSMAILIETSKEYFGITWEDTFKAYKNAGFDDTDESPILESEWFDKFYKDFQDYILAKFKG